jgi:DNA-binding PadR family transcriptional regulator
MSDIETRSFLPLTPLSFHVLLALSQGHRHGYAIIKDVERRSGGIMRPGTGTLYAAIQRLLEDGLIEESDDRPAPQDDDARRRYYALSELGRRVAEAEARRMDHLVALARQARLLTGARPIPAGGDA